MKASRDLAIPAREGSEGRPNPVPPGASVIGVFSDEAPVYIPSGLPPADHGSPGLGTGGATTQYLLKGSI